MRHALHDLGHQVKLSADQGQLIPIGIVEALPNDVFDHSTTCLIRTQPLASPVMHEIDAKIHHWFVPTRQVWKDFENFITGGPNGTDATVPPTISFTTGAPIGSLADYFGVPTGIANTVCSALPFRAYASIFNEYYRDQDLQPELALSDGNGADTITSTQLQNGCWEKDYFTSARPSPQKGSAVSIPLVGTAPVKPASVTSTATLTGIHNNNVPGGQFFFNTGTSNPMVTDLSAVSAIKLEDLRLASSIQRYKENLSRFGSRYVERVMQAFGRRPKSLDIDLPQYIGGGQQKVSISEVLSTAETTGSPVGEMYGHGITAMKSNRYRYPVPEHGYIITLLCVRPRTNYVQGLPKMWSRKTKEDYYQPELAYLGQRPILNKEIFLSTDATANEQTFGYQDAYDDYRYVESRVAGEFRDTLDYWHMARKFGTRPALNSDFVKSNPTDRIYAVPAADQLYIMVRHRISAKRIVIPVAKPQLF